MTSRSTSVATYTTVGERGRGRECDSHKIGWGPEGVA